VVRGQERALNPATQYTVTVASHFTMRLLLPILLLTLYSCNQNNSDTGTMTSCQLGRQEGLDDYEKGILHFINGEPLRYESELKGLLEQKGIKYSIDPFRHAYECYDLVMDSLIKVRFGNNFIDELKLVADNLFFEKRKNGTFDYSEVDTWALRKNNNDQLGGDFIINYLNEKLPTKSSFSFVSNIVDRPHYLIEFTVDKDGGTKNILIRERNNTEKFKGTEEIILKEVSKIKDWKPPTIKNQPVTAKFQMGVAIESRE
jgi:hypothetical protein